MADLYGIVYHWEVGAVVAISKINLHQLITFYSLATEGSFSAAAEKLFLTESAVSQQIRALQISMGVKLVYLKKKRVHLTGAGQTLLEHAEAIYDHMRSAETFLDEIKGNSLRVGVAVSFSSIVTSAAIQFESLFPNASLSIKSGSSCEIIDQLLDLQYEVAVVASINYKVKELTAIRLSDKGRFSLVTGWSTPICKGDSLTLADLQNHQFIIPRVGSATRGILLNRFQSEGLELKNPIVVEMDYPQYGKMLAELGKGIALMPETEAHNLMEQGRLRILHLVNDISVPVDALIVKNSPQNEMVEKFIELVKEAFN